MPEISCEHCVNAITSEVGSVSGVKAVNVDLNARTVEVTGGDEAAIIAAIDKAGYGVA